LIGCGAIGRPVAEAILSRHVGDAGLVAVLVRDVSKHREWVHRWDVALTDDADAFFACDFDLLVEAAGHAAVRQFVRRGLEKGTDVLVTSIGAFADDAFYDEIRTLAAMKGRRLLLASGALPAVDWMQSASLAKVHSVTITQTKPVASWRGTAAERMVDLAALTDATCFFTGSARESASTFAKSSNITAMLALSTIGMDATQVRLAADPTATAMHTSVAFKGEVGEVRVEWRGVPSESNPSTSADVPLSVIKAIRNLASPVWLGV
jgi:aspartate dehydrogenase